MSWQDRVEISALMGQVFSEIQNDGYELRFIGKQQSFKMFHEQDCCESVTLEEVVGDLDDLLNSPIFQAEEVISTEGHDTSFGDSYTWTFYKLATIKGSVTLRWYGSSNGYYSESVEIEKI